MSVDELIDSLDGKKRNSILWVNKETKKSIIKRFTILRRYFSKLFIQIKVFMNSERIKSMRQKYK